MLNGVLWGLDTGGQRRELPSEYGSLQTVHGRFQRWVREGKLEQVLRRLSAELHAQGRLALAEAFIDSTFAPTKKGGLRSASPTTAKAPKSWQSPTNMVFPLTITVDPASPYESRLVRVTLAASFLDRLPERMIGDRADDSDGLDRQLAQKFGIEIIAPHHRKTQDNRPLRRYLHRLKIERPFARPGIYRRLVVRWAFHVHNSLGMVQFACIMTLVGIGNHFSNRF